MIRAYLLIKQKLFVRQKLPNSTQLNQAFTFLRRNDRAGWHILLSYPHVNARSTYVPVFYAAASGAQPTPGASNVTGYGSHGALQLQMLSGATGKDTTSETKAISKAGGGGSIWEKQQEN